MPQIQSNIMMKNNIFVRRTKNMFGKMNKKNIPTQKLYFLYTFENHKIPI